ncbi:MAG: glycerophosphodiester phosphodiesterase family protein [Candidatus Hydrogenedentes bacterium]|nr:glycerophosphodiester phosphodiesterase family protein [Candidatus Hydrogenedentota bacterium]
MKIASHRGLSPASRFGCRWLSPIVVLFFAVSAVVVAELPLKQPKHGGVYIVAHRGVHENIPENTLPAYQRAIELGCDFVEIDVRTTKDGKFVSVHNSTIDAYVPGKTGRVKDMTLEELRALDIGARVGEKWVGTRIPTFEEILDLCKGKIGIYLDLKDAPVPELAALVKARGMQHEIIWYVNGKHLDDLRASCAECIEMPDPGPEKNLEKLLLEKKPRLVASVWNHASKSFVEACHTACAPVIIDEDGTECWKDLLAWGTDGIQTDYPEALIDYVVAHPGK